jgi:hypothetical protein
LPVFILFFYFYFEKKNLGNNPELSYDKCGMKCVLI